MALKKRSKADRAKLKKRVGKKVGRLSKIIQPGGAAGLVRRGSGKLVGRLKLASQKKKIKVFRAGANPTDPSKLKTIRTNRR
jgi:hypothetical protein